MAVEHDDTDDATGGQETSRRGLVVALWAILAGVLVVTIAAGTWRLARIARAGPPLPILTELPDFDLVDTAGRPFTESDLDGAPWVADFIFTRCGGICPVLSSAMQQLQNNVCDRGVQLVSFTVDPSFDTPAVLSDYAERFAARPSCWRFVTGERDALYALVRDGFHLVAAETPGGDPGELITHSDRLVLIDGRNRVRSYHHGTEPEAVSAVVADVDRLLSDPRR